jgi:hypothetical protein
MTLPTASGVDKSLWFDTDLLRGSLTDALLDSMEAAPPHMGDLIDRRSFGDHQGDTGNVWIFGDEGYWKQHRGDNPEEDQLGLYKSPFTIHDFYKRSGNLKTRLRREMTGGFLEQWTRNIGSTYPAHQEHELIKIVFGGLDLEGNSVTLTGIDGIALFGAHPWVITGSSHRVDPGVPATQTNQVALGATLSDGVTAGTSWSQLAVEDGFAAAMRLAASWVTDKNRPMNLEAFSDVVCLATSVDTTNTNLRTSINKAFNSNTRTSDATDRPFVGQAEPRFTPFIPAAKDDRFYLGFAPKGLDGSSKEMGRGGLVIVDHVAPESVEVEDINGRLTVSAGASHGYAIGQWWRWIEVRLNGAPA